MSTSQQPPSPSTRQPQGVNTPGAAGAPSGTAHAGDSDLKHSAHELGEQAKAEGKVRVAEARRTAADKVDTLADSTQAAAARLQQDDIGHLSEYVASLADSMTRLSTSLREKSGDEVLRDVGRLARDNPALFVTGGVAIGFGLARFARASEKRRARQDTEDVYSAHDYPVPVDDTANRSRPSTGASGTTYTSAPGATEARGTSGASDRQERPEGTRGGIH